ncbi:MULTISPECIES: rod shape-determining protein MreD [unclassified Roseivivax]|uniref:rod shape-determining protein MreD n=1 Tax=Roseivivax sp. GX 12232 TaxID=2900547 RepID=UPI001E2A1E98|nr:rod shape-determining protein MreD [Roseivivax sp. GX 12232]MCE0506971.1 rod shape-determining protein MreD [Roseivivax sp. GX 12232]
MIDADGLRIWMMRGVFVLLAGLVVFFHLLPLSHLPQLLAGPDFITLLVFAWALRRPEYVPAWLIAVVALLVDLIFQRPPGLWAALTVMVAESLKTGERRQRETNFLLEWLSVSVSLGAMVLIYQLVKLLLIIEPMGWVLALSSLLASILIYPGVVALSRILGVARAAPGDGDRLGQGA